MRRLHFCACALALAGCVEAEERSTDFEYVHAAIIEPMCATVGCHSRQSAVTPPEADLTVFSEIDLSTPTRACGILANEWGPGVVLDLLEGDYDDPSVGDNPILTQMPPDVPLPAADIEIVRAWITGANPCE